MSWQSCGNNRGVDTRTVQICQTPYYPASSRTTVAKRIDEVMEIEKLISALKDTIAFLRNSQSSDWAHLSVEEIVQELEAEIAKIMISQPIDAKRLGYLFAPT